MISPATTHPPTSSGSINAAGGTAPIRQIAADPAKGPGDERQDENPEEVEPVMYARPPRR